MTMTTTAPAGTGGPAFGFLYADVKTQRRVAERILDGASGIERLLTSRDAALGIEEIRFLEALKAELVAGARDLAENANRTSAAAAEVLAAAAADRA